MLLLDHNIPRRVKDVLKRFGVDSDTAIDKGWDKLENGELAAKAIEAGYEAILTRDRRFQQSAAQTLAKFPSFTIVLLTIPQSDSKSYCAAFSEAWKRAPISFTPGQLIE